MQETDVSNEMSQEALQPPRLLEIENQFRFSQDLMMRNKFIFLSELVFAFSHISGMQEIKAFFQKALNKMS